MDASRSSSHSVYRGRMRQWGGNARRDFAEREIKIKENVGEDCGEAARIGKESADLHYAAGSWALCQLIIRGEGAQENKAVQKQSTLNPYTLGFGQGIVKHIHSLSLFFSYFAYFFPFAGLPAHPTTGPHLFLFSPPPPFTPPSKQKNRKDHRSSGQPAQIHTHIHGYGPQIRKVPLTDKSDKVLLCTRYMISISLCLVDSLYVQVQELNV